MQTKRVHKADFYLKRYEKLNVQAKEQKSKAEEYAYDFGNNGRYNQMIKKAERLEREAGEAYRTYKAVQYSIENNTTRVFVDVDYFNIDYVYCRNCERHFFITDKLSTGDNLECPFCRHIIYASHGDPVEVRFKVTPFMWESGRLKTREEVEEYYNQKYNKE